MLHTCIFLFNCSQIFRASNLQQTLQLIMSVVSTSNDLSVLRNANGLTRLLLNNCGSFSSILKE